MGMSTFNENEKKNFAERLNSAIYAQGVAEFGRSAWLQERLSFDISINGIKKWLKGESMPAVARLSEIANVCKTTVPFLLSGEAQGDDTEFNELASRLAELVSKLPSNERYDKLLELNSILSSNK